MAGGTHADTIMNNAVYIKTDFEINTNKLDNEFYWDKGIYIATNKCGFPRANGEQVYIINLFGHAKPVPKYLYKCSNNRDFVCETIAISDEEAKRNAMCQEADMCGGFFYDSNSEWYIQKCEQKGFRHEPSKYAVSKCNDISCQ